MGWVGWAVGLAMRPKEADTGTNSGALGRILTPDISASNGCIGTRITGPIGGKERPSMCRPLPRTPTDARWPPSADT